MFQFTSLLRSRFLVLPAVLQRIFLWAAVLNFFHIVLTLWVFSHETAEKVFMFQIDKIMHFAGGVFTAGVCTVAGFARTRTQFIICTLIIGVLWEIWEVAFLQDQRALFSLYYWAWFSDTALDLAADVLGAYWWSNLLFSKQFSVQEKGA